MKKKLLCATILIAILASCKGNSSSKTVSDQTPMRYGREGVGIELKEGGYYRINSMKMGDGLLRLSGKFIVNREASDFCAYMIIGTDTILTFNLVYDLKKDWSLNLDGFMEFSFILPDGIYDIIRANRDHIIPKVIYTDFGLGPAESPFFLTGWISDDIAEKYSFYQLLYGGHCVGDLDCVLCD